MPVVCLLDSRRHPAEEMTAAAFEGSGNCQFLAAAHYGGPAMQWWWKNRRTGMELAMGQSIVQRQGAGGVNNWHLQY